MNECKTYSNILKNNESCNQQICELKTKKTKIISIAPNEIKTSFNNNVFQNFVPNFETKSNGIISISNFNSNEVYKNKADGLSKYVIMQSLDIGLIAIFKSFTNKTPNKKTEAKLYEEIKVNDNSKIKCVHRENLKRNNHKIKTKLVETIHSNNLILIIQELINEISLRRYFTREVGNQKKRRNILKELFK